VTARILADPSNDAILRKILVDRVCVCLETIPLDR